MAKAYVTCKLPLNKRQTPSAHVDIAIHTGQGQKVQQSALHDFSGAKIQEQVITDCARLTLLYDSRALETNHHHGSTGSIASINTPPYTEA